MSNDHSSSTSARIGEIAPLAWAQKTANAVMKKYAPSELPPPNRWHYHQGVFLHGLLRLWQVTRLESNYEYAKSYADFLIALDGSLEYRKGELDAVQAANMLYYFQERKPEARYEKVLRHLITLLDDWKRTPEGGFWHKHVYPDQMWLDGLYMAGPYACHFAKMFGRPEYYDMILEQAKLMQRYTFDPATGLYRHGWDSSKMKEWADKTNGQSPEVWGRALGWFAVALLDILDYMPEKPEYRDFLIATFRDLVPAIVKYQDPASGIWYQVVDKPDLEGNWLETSCSALFVYAISKGVRLGLIDRRYLETAVRGYEGILAFVKTNPDGNAEMHNICVGTGVGDYAHYIARDTTVNDLHGSGTFVMASVELHRAGA